MLSLSKAITFLTLYSLHLTCCHLVSKKYTYKGTQNLDGNEKERKNKKIKQGSFNRERERRIQEKKKWKWRIENFVVNPSEFQRNLIKVNCGTFFKSQHGKVCNESHVFSTSIVFWKQIRLIISFQIILYNSLSYIFLIKVSFCT